MATKVPLSLAALAAWATELFRVWLIVLYQRRALWELQRAQEEGDLPSLQHAGQVCFL